jgi:hypothetical protein
MFIVDAGMVMASVVYVYAGWDRSMFAFPGHDMSWAVTSVDLDASVALTVVRAGPFVASGRSDHVSGQVGWPLGVVAAHEPQLIASPHVLSRTGTLRDWSGLAASALA